MISSLKTLFGIAWGTAVLGANFYELGQGGSLGEPQQRRLALTVRCFFLSIRAITI
jgi:hypothetical protein